MIAAVYQGLFNPPQNASSIIPFDCPTGNCTFPADNGAMHSSLGMCYSYQDISDSIITDSSGWVLALPSGPEIDTSAIDTLSTGLVRDDIANLLSFDTIMSRYQDLESTSASLPPFAFRSTLNPCVRTYFANISSFVLDERILATTPLTYLSGSYDYLLVTNATLGNGTWRECIPTSIRSEDNPTAFPFSTFLGLAENASVQYYPADCVWSFQFDAIQSFAYYVSLLFDKQNLTSAYGTPANAEGPNHLLNLAAGGTANSTTVERFLEGLANTITANMRQRGDTQPDEYATGTVQEAYICIQVIWVWLSLPALLLVLGLGFVSFVILQTNHAS